MARRIELAQALFGYSEGHRLIASSVPMSPDMRHFLARVTDGSGSGGYQGFEIAYTGLPVQGTPYYALFATWPAPEMTRPGCVWSHLLLLDLNDLALIPDLTTLLPLFVRPTSGWRKETFEQPLSIPQGESHFLSMRQAFNADSTTVLLSALYSAPNRDIVVLDESNIGWTEALFAVWSQQWPSLRRRFSFSSGSLGDRRFNDVSFDLQVAPRTTSRIWQKTESSTLLIEKPFDTHPEVSLPWLPMVVNDALVCDVGSPLRRFLNTYSDDVPDSRSAFGKLAEHFFLVHGSGERNPAIALEHLTLAFSKPEEAIRLKRDEVARILRSDGEDGFESAWGITQHLLLEPPGGAFSKVPVAHLLDTDFLWPRKQKEILAILGSITNEVRARHLERELSRSVSPSDLPNIWRAQPSVLPALLSHNPALAAQQEAWHMPIEGQEFVWESLVSTAIQPQQWAPIAAAMLLANVQVREVEAIQLSGSYFWAALSNLLEREPIPRIPTERWRTALHSTCALALDLEVLRPTLLALAAWAIPTVAARRISAERSDVQELVELFPRESLGPLTLPTHFWLVAIGLSTGGPAGFASLKRSYSQVYDAVASNNYASEWWELVEPLLPRLRWFDWNRLSRLRLGLIRFLETEPSYSAFDTVNSDAVTRVIDFYYQSQSLNQEERSKHGDSIAFSIATAFAENGEMNKAIESYLHAQELSHGDRNTIGEATTACAIAAACAKKGDVDRAIEFYQHGLTISREIGEKNIQATALSGIASAYARKANANRAIEYFQQGLSISREVGNKNIETTALGGIAAAYARKGDSDRAIEYYKQGLAISREIGEKNVETTALSGIAAAYARKGDSDRAIEIYHQVLAVCREVGNKNGEATALSSIAAAYARKGDSDRAIEIYHQVLAVCREVGNKNGEATALSSIAAAYSRKEDYNRVIEHYQQVLAISREVGDKNSEATALRNMAIAFARKGDSNKAIEHFENSIALNREVGNRHAQAVALVELASAYERVNDLHRAIRYLEESLTIRHEIGDARGEARSVTALATLLYKMGDKPAAIQQYQRALLINEQLGDARAAESIRITLSHLH